MQAISGEQIQKRDLTSLEKIAASTPQFTVARASNGAGAQFTMRGIGCRPPRSAYLAWQERRVRYFHENLEKWMND